MTEGETRCSTGNAHGHARGAWSNLVSMNSSSESQGAAALIGQTISDPRVFLRLPLEERRRLMALQAVGADLYSVGSEAHEWLEQAEDDGLLSDE